MAFTIKTGSLDEFIAEIEKRGAEYVEARISEHGVDRRMPLNRAGISFSITPIEHLLPFEPEFRAQYVARTPVIGRKITYEEKYNEFCGVFSDRSHLEPFEYYSSRLVVTVDSRLEKIKKQLPYEIETSIVGPGGTLDEQTLDEIRAYVESEQLPNLPIS